MNSLRRIIKLVFLTVTVAGFCLFHTALAEPRQETDILYLDQPDGAIDEFQAKQCRLDVYAPDNSQNLPVIIWLHGGGMRGGSKYIPVGLKNQGVVVVAPNYRLYPTVTCPAYIQDVAAAVAWTFENISRYGGDPQKIFLSGFSAGGYLSAMVGIDSRWLGEHGIRTTQLAGVSPVSGMMTTHFTVREERGDTSKVPVIDEFAPMMHCTADAPPLLFFTGDRDKDWPGRMEENQLIAKTLKIVGHKDVTIYELKGLGHNGAQEKAAFPIMLEWIREHVGE